MAQGKKVTVRTLQTLLVCLWLTAAGRAEVRFTGQVQSNTREPLNGARILIKIPDKPLPVQSFSDIHGLFAADLPDASSFLVTIERDGFYPVRDRAIDVTAGIQATFELVPVREITQTVDVTSAPVGIDMETATSQRSVTSTEIVNVPYQNTNDFRQALRIIPGVVRDNRGGVHVNGGGEEQVMYTLNGFNITDPLTGRFDSRLSVESVQAVEISSGNMAAEYGRGSAGTMAIRTNTGDDKLRYTATNFVPGVENRKGLIIGDWTPRANLSGPILKGRAWFSDSVDVQYVNTVIRDLPKGEDRGQSMRLSNLLHTQVNLSPSNILYTSFLFNRWTAGRTGLSALDPISTTLDRRTRQWFFSVKDQAYLPGRVLLEFGFAANRTFGRDIPQGEGILSYTPEGRRGYAFVDAIRQGARDQFLINGFLPSFTLLGSHQLKSGLDLDRAAYDQDIRRTGFENYSDVGALVRRTFYAGSGALSLHNYETAWYLQDSWRVRSGVLVELGIRTDWTNILHRWDWSPRFGIAYSPHGLINTKLFGGFSQIFDGTNLRVFSRPLDQFPVTTYYDPTGDVARGPALTLFTIANPRLRRPQYRIVTAGVEQSLFNSVMLRAEYMRRTGRRGFSFLNTADDPSMAPPAWALEQINGCTLDAVLSLTNQRRDEYNSISFTVKQNIRKQYEWMASYVHSRAASNTVVDVTAEDPVVVTDNRGRLPWDAPHRFLSWAYLPTPFKNWAVTYFLETRSGYPFSFVGEDGKIQGLVNQRRFPNYFELNLHLERRFVFRHYRWALRFGANNLTNRINPDTVNNVITSSRFLQFYGGVGRSVNFRIRWLGRAQ